MRPILVFQLLRATGQLFVPSQGDALLEELLTFRETRNPKGLD
jgi:hypothetical protein